MLKVYITCDTDSLAGPSQVPVVVGSSALIVSDSLDSSGNAAHLTPECSAPKLRYVKRVA